MAAPALGPRDLQPVEPPASQFVDALINLFDAGQAVVLDRIDLLRMQLSDDVVRFAMSAGLIFGGVAFAMLSYLVCMVGVTGLLNRVMAWEFALLIVGGVHLVLGVVIVIMSARMTRVDKTRSNAMQEMVDVA